MPLVNMQALRAAPGPRPSVPAPQAPPRAVMPPTLSRRSVSCCWPIGEPGTKTFRFCDDTSVGGKPYCEDHARLAYVRVRDRKDDAA
jgi:GcrA cell cycle regulator